MGRGGWIQNKCGHKEAVYDLYCLLQLMRVLHLLILSAQWIFPIVCHTCFFLDLSGYKSFWEVRIWVSDLIIVCPQNAAGTCSCLPILLPWCHMRVRRMIQLNVAPFHTVYFVLGVAERSCSRRASFCYAWIGGFGGRS